MALLASRLLHRHLLCSSAAFSFSCRLNHRLLYPSSSYEWRATPVHPRPSLRAALRRKKQGSQKDARRRGALWLINTRRLVRGRTVTHVHGVGRSLSLSFPFSVSVPLCHPSPHAFAAHPSLSFIYLSLSSFLNHVPFFFSPSLPPSLRAVTLFFPGSPSSSVLFSPTASLFSCYLFVFRALDFSPASFTVPSDFSSPLCLSTVLLPFVYYLQLLAFNPFLPRHSIFLPFVPLYIPPPPP